MNQKFYIKNVMLAVRQAAAISQLEALVRKIKEDGISVQTLIVERKKLPEELSVELTENLPEELLPQELLSCGEETLYITDCGETAVLLREKGCPVLGFWHEKEESFAGIEYIMESPKDLDTCYLDRVYRRYRDIPWDILETERCFIRETVADDVEGFYAIYHHPDIVRYTEGLYPEKEQERKYIREYIDKVYRYFEFGVWTVIWKETGEVIGRAGFSVREGYELPELGFVIGVPWQGKGVAYEICSAILRYGEEEYDLRRVQALVMPENAASLTLCRKLGFAEKERVWEENTEYCLLVREAKGEQGDRHLC